jgi:Tol biopolymer transport system component
MACYGDKVYVMKGGNSSETWVYDRTDSTHGWLEADSVPRAPSGRPVKAGGCMAAAHGFLWALKGKKTPDYYRFLPTLRLTPPPSSPQPPPPGSNEMLIAAGGDAGDVRLSHSGVWAAYARDTNGHRQLFKALASGGGVTQLTWLAGECGSPVWSPTDDRIAFHVTLDDSNYSQIAVVPGYDQSVTFLTASGYDDFVGDWSSDGANITFARDDSSQFRQVYVVPAAGGQAQALTSTGVDHDNPRFLDSATVVYESEGGNGFTQLCKVSIGSLTEAILTSSPTDHRNPAPANAGFIVYEFDDPAGYSQIGRISNQGGQELVLTSGRYDFESPTVTPNGLAIFCTMSSGPGAAICQVDPSGQGYVQLTDELVERVSPSTQPGSDNETSTLCAYARDGDVFRLTDGGSGQQSGGHWALALAGAEPNPASRSVRFRWMVPVEADVSLRIYNTAGQLVKVLASGKTKPGAYTTVWNGTDAKGRRLANGVYICALAVEGRRFTRKVVLTE